MRDDIQKALEVLKGGLILYPTDTIWGIGCDATNEEAVKKLYAKRRDDRQSMLILIDRPERLQAYVQEVPLRGTYRAVGSTAHPYLRWC